MDWNFVQSTYPTFPSSDKIEKTTAMILWRNYKNDYCGKMSIFNFCEPGEVKWGRTNLLNLDPADCLLNPPVGEKSGGHRRRLWPSARNRTPGRKKKSRPQPTQRPNSHLCIQSQQDNRIALITSRRSVTTTAKTNYFKTRHLCTIYTVPALGDDLLTIQNTLVKVTDT